MEATKATNIQIRLLFEESLQLNSKKRNTRKKHKFLADEMMPISNYMQKKKTKNWLPRIKKTRIRKNRSYYLSLV